MSLHDLEKGLNPAKLLPTNNIKNAEARITSITLAIIAAIPELAERLLSTVDVRVGQRSSIRAYIEPELRRNKKTNKSDDRPDGLIVHQNGKKIWMALVEAKVNNADVQEQQVKKYIQLASEPKISVDAIITISNQFVAVPSHHPLNSLLDKRRKVRLFHWSWTNIETQVVLLLEDSDFLQPEKRLLLREYLTFLQSDGSGVTKFTSMHKDWSELVKVARTEDLKIPKSEMTENAVGSWHQECRDIVLKLARDLKQPVSLKLRRDHVNNPTKRLDDDIKQLIEKRILTAELQVQNAASEILITANVQSKMVTLSMSVAAPQDIATYKGRIGWLTRQLRGQEDYPIEIYVYGKRKTQLVSGSLKDILDKDFDDFWAQAKLIEPSRFDVRWQSDFSREFAQSRGFIVKFEELVSAFYEAVGQKLQRYQPAPPKLRKDVNNSDSLIEDSDKS